MITKKLYDIDSHLCAFESEVLTASYREGLWTLELAETAFFPEGGGQASDRGTLDGYEVARMEEAGEHIFHYVSAPEGAFSVGQKVRGEIDWVFRFTNMQQHSGEHILSGVCYAWKGYHNVGFHMNETSTTVDFDGPLTEEEVRELFLRANRVVYENLPVKILYPDAQTLAAMDYRSKKALEGEVRIVQVGDIDLCACCAPHVMHTGEVGLIRLSHFENYKGGVRLTILCGERAYLSDEEVREELGRIAKGLSTGADKVRQSVESLKAEVRDLKEGEKRQSREIIELRLALLEKESPQEEVLVFEEQVLDQVALRRYVEELSPRYPRLVAALCPGKEGGAFFLLASQKGESKEYLDSLKEKFTLRGGGNDKLCQGTLEGKSDEIYRLFKGVIKNK